MAIPFLNHLDLRSVSELQNAILHKTTTATASNVEGKFLYDTGTNTMQYYNGTAWINLDGTDTGITSVTLASDGDATSGNTITTNGTLTLSFDGAASEYVDGQGNLVTFPTIPTVNNGTLTVQGTGVLGGSGTFTANQSGNTTISVTHDNTSRTDTTSTGSGNTFTVVDSVTTNATGHVTAINVKTQTVTDDDTTSLPIKNAVGTTQFTSTDVTGLRFEGGTNVTVDFTSADQTVKINSTDQYQGTVTGTGTTNILPKWTNGGSGVLGNSSITDDGTTVTIAGNLDVQGTTTTIDSTTVAIGDNMMKYAKDNTANASDIGWYGKIVASGTKYPGMFYDASSGISTPVFKVGLSTTEPGGTATIATKGTIDANLTGNVTGNLTGNVTGNVTGSSGSCTGNAATATTLQNSRNFSITGDITAAAVAFNGSGNVVLNANIDANVVGATELNVSGNGTSGQVLASDGDGTFSWANATVDTQLATAAALIDASAMGANTTASFTHNLASKNLIVQMYDVTSGEVVFADIDHTSNSAISIIFAATPTNDIRVVVIDAKNGLTDKTVSYS